MSELSGTATVGIETVEWLDGGSGNLIVRVTGRWRRRRPAPTAQVMLMIESEGRRHRFPAMPEPPSVGGTGPGMWRLSFSVPGSLAPALGGNIWLALGTATVPLPAPDAGELVSAQTRIAEPAAIEATAPPDELAPADRISELERQLAEIRSERDGLTASVAEGERTRRIAEQRAHAEEALRTDLTRRLASHERQTERVREAMGELAAAEDRIRTLERQLRDARRREAEAEQQAAAAAARARPRPAADQASSPAVRPSSPPAAGPVPPAARDREAAQLRFEHRLRARMAHTGARVPAEPDWPLAEPAWPPVGPPASPKAPAVPAPPVSTQPANPASVLVDTLRRELDARAAGEAALRSRLVAAETGLAARVLLDQRTTEALRQLRIELDGLRAALAQEQSRREAAVSRAAELEAERRARSYAERRSVQLERELRRQRERSRDAYDAIGQLRGVLEQLATAPAPAGRHAVDAPAPASEAVPLLEPASSADPGPSAEPGPSVEPGPSAEPGPSVEPAPATETGAATETGTVQVDRLSDALTRLRESVAAPEATVVSRTAGGRTLESVFRRLVKRDAAVAGELLLDLLVLQRAAYPHPVAYDLVLGPGRGCVRVTVGEGPPVVERHGAARTREEVDFRVRGEPARIARLLSAHGIWRLLGPRVARVRGRRDGLVALQALLSLPLDLAALRDAGAMLHGEAVLGLVAGMVDAAWTAGETFVIAYRDPDGALIYLTARDGRALAVTRTAPAGRVAATIDGPVDVLVTVLSGAPAPAGRLTGDEGPLQSLRTWIKRAQSA